MKKFISILFFGAFCITFCSYASLPSCNSHPCICAVCSGCDSTEKPDYGEEDMIASGPSSLDQINFKAFAVLLHGSDPLEANASGAWQPPE